MAQSYLRSPTIQRLPELIEWLRTGELQIPSFQRAIVWSSEQRISLCDTIMRGLPIGSVMVWRTTRKLATKGFGGPFEESAALPQFTTHQYLLDGQQRLTTLYAALGPAFWTREDEIPPWRDARKTAPDGTPWRIGFDVSTDKGHFVCLEDTVDSGKKILPLDVLLDDSAYDDWRTGDHQLDREQKNRARAIRSTFVDYLIPVVPLATDELEPVTLTFKRVNSGGTTMGDFDMVRALSWNPEFDLETVLSEKVIPVLEEFGWQDLDRDVLLRIIATAYGMSFGEIEWETFSGKITADPEKFVKVSGALRWAINVLKDIGFGGPKTLPYKNILIFTARAWLDGWEKSVVQLKTWLVEAAMEGRFAAAPPHIVNAAWRDLDQTLGGESGSQRQKKSPKPSRGVNFRWARSMITTAVLGDQEPRDAEGGAMPNAKKLLGRYGKDWYPKLLESSGNDKNRHYGTAANRVVCDPLKLVALRAEILKENCDMRVLESHAISKDAHDALLRNDIARFFDLRFDFIIELENRWLKKHGSELKVEVEASRGSS